MKIIFLTSLAWACREAENHYLNTGDDKWKVITSEIVENANLTKLEQQHFDNICQEIAV